MSHLSLLEGALVPPGTLPVAEIFGPVWQGEGPFTGFACSFLRLGECNLHCEWCDSAFTWDKKNHTLDFDNLTADQVLARIPDNPNGMLVISGGEPLLHSRRQALVDIVERWANQDGSVHVETNGTIPPPDWYPLVEQFAVSPKLNTRADPERRRWKPRVLQAWAEISHSYLKVVVSTAKDIDLLADRLDDDRCGNWTGRVWVMPEGRTAADVIAHAQDIAPAAAYYGYNLTLRQQTILYGDERGH